ncbi:MAG: flagellin [Thermodesulfobacteriota bacterium]
MSLSPYFQTFLYDYSSQLLRNDLLTNSVFYGSGVGQSLRDMVLDTNNIRPLTNPFEQAITGKLRSDAASVRQNSDNVSEAASMVGIGREAVGQIKGALEDMEEIIDKINSGELDGDSDIVQEDYDNLREKIIGLVESTDYNGIHMLDKSQWGTEQIDSDGSVYIQAFKDGGFDVNFYPLDTANSDFDWNNLQGSNLANEVSRSTQLSYVESYLSDVNAIYDMYESKEGSLESHAASLNNQADILDQAVQSRMSSSLSVEQILLNLILSDSGGIIDEST